mgnify:CR=1 FL=1
MRGIKSIRKTLIVLFLSTISNLGFGQDSTLVKNQMSVGEIDSIFTDSIKNKFKINYKVYRAYKYKDKIGNHIILMTEKVAKIKKLETYYDTIIAYHFIVLKERLVLKWTVKDFIIKEEYSMEHSINFWTKYFAIDDYDGDGNVDPILVYGSFGANGTDDGRIKILIFYKGKKRAIRHHNGTLDSERNTQVDKAFYQLPIEIQKRVKLIMVEITKNDHGIFPYGWQDAMKNNKLYFDEN